MLKEFVDWEATLAKPVQTSSFFFNRFDAFRFRQNLATNVFWREGNVWADDANPTVATSMMRDDPYANAVLVFQPRNDASYTSTNNISRSVGLSYTRIDTGQFNPAGLEEFMLNELRFNGQFSGAAAQSGTLAGFPLLFVKSLTGVGPTIKLQNTSTTANNFTFNVNMAVVLHADLEITGNSSQLFAINGQIRDFDEARSLTKSGTSAVTLSANNTYFGNTIVNGGTLRIQGASAALANTAKVQIGAQGTVALASGRIHTPQVSVAAGGAFNFTGGILETSLFSGSLTNNGGEFRPGLNVGAATVTGDFTQNTGSLAIQIGGLTPGTQYDQVLVGDDAALNASLAVSLVNLGGGTFSPAAGSSFEILRAAGVVSGEFDSVSVPTLTGNRQWAIKYGASSVWLQVVANLAADFDDNGVVDHADLSVWRNTQGVNASGDADGDGDTDGNDFLVWQQQLGSQLVPSTAAVQAVPEPHALLLAVFAAAGLAMRRRKRSSCEV
jgi:autotransporter-associated beta strand protein